MSVNSSTYSSESCLHPQHSSINYSLPYEPGCLIFTTFTIAITILLLLPLCILVLYHGLKRWQQHRSSSTAASTSHSDSFTYHLATMELFNVFGSILHYYLNYEYHFAMLMTWYYLFSITWYGQTFFQVLTCVEHYLAVVHPMIYMNLRKERWIRFRDFVIGCIWLLCFGLTSLMAKGNSYDLIVDVCLLIISVIIISFCSISVLFVLIRPGPGEKGRDRERVHQSKQRAFNTIVAILGALLLRQAWNLFWSVQSVLNGWVTECVLSISGSWMTLPSSLVLPLLYLHKTGMLTKCKTNIKSV